ncbi:MAG: permease-like cell division protein FtsX [Candidatus Vogelbacteria bacterium]
MWLANIKRIIKSGFVNFWRSGVVSLSSVIVLTVTLFTIGGLFLGQAFLSASLDEIKAKVDISVSFQPTATEEAVLAFKETLQTRPGVKQVSYRSRAEEFNDFKARNQDNALIMQSLEEVGNPLGARLNIEATDPSQYENIASFLRDDNALASPSGGLSVSGQSIIYQINFKKTSVDALSAIIDTTQRVSLAIALFLIFISLIVTFNTVSLAIYISREEISVMRLVGANNPYIRGPFIVEGLIAGFFASLLALFLLYPTAIWFRNATAGVAQSINLVAYYLEHFTFLALLLIVSGLLVSVLASILAIRKHLRI